MTWTKERIEEERAKTLRRLTTRTVLEFELRKVLNSPKYNELSNCCKAEILLDLENNGEYDPEGFD